ncbi:hypothetical protein FB567DRAFT_611511 [Paraphoma chrysanthemicola]|uniref:Uncharacterized protein n=1 Tax=Paraphoma chrysanthemicola TaxID=798071 RepID=A0A8K0QV76_9PLEO|nr:hypothetical protein FB567DRAFT_611511 [Paraphoma chrysanthemicola]
MSQLREKATEEQKQWKKEKLQLERQHREQQEQWRDEQNKLKKEIRSRNNALVKRETFNHLSDGEITAIFGELTNEINTLARLKWTRNGSPWTEELQKRMSDTPKRLQRQILQDTIWTSLFVNIFSSPFRMLGNEGSRLEVQWSKDFGIRTSSEGKTYKWPNPTFASERWRLEVMRKCQEALEQPISEYDSREKLVNGYKESLSRVQKDITQNLELVSSLDEVSSRSIDRLIEKASKMWVAFGAQRCRLMVVMTGLKSTIETSRHETSSERSVELILSPGLSRIGDAEGELFEGETIITGCAGESVKITY